MSTPLRRLDSHGLARFGDFLTDLRRDATLSPPGDLLEGDSSTSIHESGIEVERPGFTTKREAAEYLKERLGGFPVEDIMADAGLWSWLALFYFDDVCPLRSSGRKPVADSHYILDVQNPKRRYRHLLATPFRIIMSLPDHNRIFLDAPLAVHGDLIEQTMSRLYLIRLSAVRALIDRLYYDEEAGRAKRGILPRKEKPGDLRNRLPIRLRQLLATYDVAGINGETLLGLLGDEFRGWVR